jgi:hypothetical protein
MILYFKNVNFKNNYTKVYISKTDRHDIAEILLKVALKQNKSINQSYFLITSRYITSRVIIDKLSKR